MTQDEARNTVESQVDDNNWADLLSQHQETYKKASRSGSDWKPPASTDGIQYAAELSRLRKGTMKTGGPYWALYAELMDGQDPESGESLEGREFQAEFFTLANDTKAGFLKDWASKLHGGTTVEDISAADMILTDAVERHAVIQITAKQKGVHTNIYLDEVIESDLSNKADEAD